MIKGIGVDIWSVKEMQALLNQQAPFLHDHFTQNELDDAKGKPSPAQSLAARYAAKEAALKASSHTNMFGPPDIVGGIDYREIEVANDPEGIPYLLFHGRFAEVLQQRGIVKSFLSLSHKDDSAIAFVVYEG